MLPEPFYHLAVYTSAAIALVSLLLLLAWWLGAKPWASAKRLPYESGMFPSASARLPWPVHFYLIAVFFIVFDVETAFIFAWAVAWEVLGIEGVIQISIFIIILAAGLTWIWLKGGLEWGPVAARCPVRGRGPE